MNRVDVGGYTLPLDLDSIMPGDWLKSRTCGMAMGTVIAVGSIKYGKGWIPGFKMQFINGREDFIARDDAFVLGLAGNPANQEA